MYQVDLHSKNATVDSALYQLEKSIELMRKTKEHIGCFIVGYGSTGGTHKIKTAILNALEEKLSKHQIKGYILGSEIDIFNVKYQNLKGKEWIDEATKKRRNPGEVLVII
ncbi:MAG: hypothetical protein K2H02_05450 [Anaeroplasmataceae bacterium]|nr:hypothetical protein [Anaeroplasmataceae bacterium]